MTTWQIFEDSGGCFRWSLAGGVDIDHQQEEIPESLAPQLPSMADLLCRAQMKLLEDDQDDKGGMPMLRSSVSVMARYFLDGDEAVDRGHAAVVDDVDNKINSFSMFRTGSGKSVTVKESSKRKAVAVLEPENLQRGAGTVMEVGGNNNEFPMFRTGSGKFVMVRQSSIRKAAAVLEGDIPKIGAGTVVDGGGNNDGFPMFHTGSGFAVRRSSIRKAVAVLEGDFSEKEVLKPVSCRGNNDDLPKFQTGSGKSVTLKQSSIRKAMAILQDGEETETEILRPPSCGGNKEDVPMFQTGSGRSVPLKQSSIRKAMAILQDGENVETDQTCHFTVDGHHKFPNSTFQTGFGRTQNVGMSCGLLKLPPPVPKSNTPLKSSSLRGTKFNGVMQNQGKANGFLSEDAHHQDRCIPSSGPLLDISNIDCANMSMLKNDKRRPWRRSSTSPFKRPRISRFITPLDNNSFFSTGSIKSSTSEKQTCRARVCLHYPFKFRRKTLREFFGGPPAYHNLARQLPTGVQNMNADNAETYRFCGSSGLSPIGPEAFQNMLLHSGATLSSVNKEWVANHYKWIVWKLACLERCYPALARGKFLTASNVLEELKYRYEREVNYGHRSAVKRILEGDASPASMIVLCISSIHSCSAPKIGIPNDMVDVLGDNGKLSSSYGVESEHATKIELTDGWYSLDAILDVLLAKQLVDGKLFVGQKLRIWGAGLFGWIGPVSPLEASKTVNLLIHMNGTYRAHWSSLLGFCKGLGPPLAFRCIKGGGGKVPRTLVGVTRIYPILYKERFLDGRSIVRSERMERKALQLYIQRRSNIAEDVMTGKHDEFVDASDDEGARIYRILETSAEPDLLMADMSSEQLITFSTYQAKQEAKRQYCMQKKIEKALEDAGLSSRDVTPFMRVRVVGLTTKDFFRKGQSREGLITIWNPNEKQKLDLVEGQIYCVSGLVPLTPRSDILYLQAKGSSTVWEPLSSLSKKFEPFFTARKPVLLSTLPNLPLGSEFDIAAVVVHVGEVYLCGSHTKQWVFLTDGSRCSSGISYGLDDCVLAVSFCTPVDYNDSSGLFSPHLSGTVVGLCNLVKRARDQTNHLWVAEATETSTYSVWYNLPKAFHLKGPAGSAREWAKRSSSFIQMLRERILCIVGGCES